MSEIKKWEWNPDPSETNILRGLRGPLFTVYILYHLDR